MRRNVRNIRNINPAVACNKIKWLHLKPFLLPHSGHLYRLYIYSSETVYIYVFWDFENFIAFGLKISDANYRFIVLIIPKIFQGKNLQAVNILSAIISLFVENWGKWRFLRPFKPNEAFCFILKYMYPNTFDWSAEGLLKMLALCF